MNIKDLENLRKRLRHESTRYKNIHAKYGEAYEQHTCHGKGSLYGRSVAFAEAANMVDKLIRAASNNKFEPTRE